jgi:hypothetical protein
VLRAFTPEEIRAFFEALGASFDAPAELVVVGVRARSFVTGRRVPRWISTPTRSQYPKGLLRRS